MKDRSSKLVIGLIAVALWAIVLRPIWQPATAQAQADKPTPVQYEYYVAVGDDPRSVERQVNEGGKQGWRAAGFSVLPLYQPQVIVLMERRVDAP